MKLKRFRNKFISMLLTLAMLLTLFPTAVFAEDTAADRPASAEFKIMGLYALRDNGRRVSFFSYESRDNAFLTKANMTYPDSWFKLIYTPTVAAHPNDLYTVTVTAVSADGVTTSSTWTFRTY